MLLSLHHPAWAADLCRIALKRLAAQAVTESRPSVVEIPGQGLMRFRWDDSSGTLEILAIEVTGKQRANGQIYQNLYRQMVAEHPTAKRVIFPNGKEKNL